MSEQVRDGFRQQGQWARVMGAHRTAALCDALAARLSDASETGRRVLNWPRDVLADAVALRLIGGLNALRQAGAGDVEQAFSGEPGNVDAVVRVHDEALQPWLDSAPQTNEPQRSAALVTGLLHVAATFGTPLELIEIGSSAGLNLMIPHYRYNLGGVKVGPNDAALTMTPEWRGSPPPDVPLTIARARGCDLRPIDLADPAAEARVAAYIWIDNPERVERLAKAAALVREHGVRIDRADAADWVEARLAEPVADGMTRVLMHSVTWQYLPTETQARIGAAMAAAGARGPLGWVRMEPDRDLAAHRISVTTWPGGETRWIGSAHAHARWVEHSG
ncbi:MAG: DUF2332 family protein [Pseudomonadota bacterium]